jgi:hypothetical protein
MQTEQTQQWEQQAEQLLDRIAMSFPGHCLHLYEKGTLTIVTKHTRILNVEETKEIIIPIILETMDNTDLCIHGGKAMSFENDQKPGVQLYTIELLVHVTGGRAHENSSYELMEDALTMRVIKPTTQA